MSHGIHVTESDKSVFAEHRYTFNQLLGTGTYAKVWLVKYSNTDGNTKKDNLLLACKVIDNEKSPRTFTRKFLPREIDILSKVKHPHLIQLHSIYQWKTKIFIFMRYAEKGDLLDYILINGEVKENRARLWTHQLSLGLQYLHELDIVHRDIKCENVLITNYNNVKLADFGFSRFVTDTSGRRYLSSTYCGSIAYAAPELLKGRPYDPKCSDIWSLGVVLYVMLNQCMPFVDTDLKTLYDIQMDSKWSFRSRVASRLSEDVIILVHGMLRPDTATRFLINDVVNNPWFLADNRLKAMSEKEREALEVGKRNKIEMVPKSRKFSILFWKKSKKDEQIVHITSLHRQHSSGQFNLDVSSST
ncbi:testis-specific serine/threonine-protein kinase 3-like [Lycorma delicatula]|uniref:testis-specific serine/threonine-protein kinase 3-like n=1 Tax=Lycorma delicatula TaxID=130591 RepID=UPI003F50DDD5